MADVVGPLLPPNIDGVLELLPMRNVDGSAVVRVRMRGTLRRSRLRAALASVILLAGTGTGAAPAAAADPLSDVEFVVGAFGLFGAPSAGGGMGQRGSWTFEHGQMVDGKLELHLEISPVPQQLPVKSGPAVLFAGLNLYGTPGGDVGLDLPIAPLYRTVVAPCENDAACHYSVDIEISTDAIPDAIKRLEKQGDLLAVEVALTLVRTFGDGQWLQVTELLSGPSGRSDAIAGRLGAMDSAHGALSWAGLFPADQALPIPMEAWNLARPFNYAKVVESLRSDAGDDFESHPDGRPCRPCAVRARMPV